MADALSDKDKQLFRREMQTVTPLGKSRVKKAAKIQERKSISGRSKSQDETMLTQSPVDAIYLSTQYMESVQADSVLAYSIPGLPLKRYKQLKQGSIKWQARLDLHGLRVDGAADTLRAFIKNQSEQGHRCLLIVHGKGGHHGEPPIIKSYVNHWLKQFPNVLAFHSAQPRAGGTGAVYVLLRRIPTAQ